MTDGRAGVHGPLPILSVVTASRGRHDALRRKALALLRQTLPPDAFEWCLWLNEAPEEVARVRAMLDELRLPYDVRLAGGEDHPVGRARNLAAARSRGTVLLLSDDDCLPAEGALAAHVAFHASTPNAVGIGPLRLPEALRKGARSEPFERPAALGRRAAWINLTGANSSLPSEAFRAVGGYDPDWTGYGGEDPELALRLRGRGSRFRHVPDGVAVHEGRVWDDADKAYRAGWAHQRVSERHRGSGAAWALGVHPWVLVAKRTVLGGPLGRLFDPEVLRYEQAYARGARDAARAAGSVPARGGGAS